MRRADLGPSPRLRGTRHPNQASPKQRRSIPAPAGNTGSGSWSWRPRPVHPRACGEHERAVIDNTPGGGPSPRLRGTLFRVVGSPPLDRSIPAPAGNTPRLTESSVPWAVHPRACGEHPCGIIASYFETGPSPRLRGTRTRPRSSSPTARSIPAPAGNTSPSAGRNSASSVHPRACGEHPWSMELDPTLCGPSPRLRGTR